MSKDSSNSSMSGLRNWHLSSQVGACIAQKVLISDPFLCPADKAASVIFGNIEDILLLDTTLLSDLEARQKDQRLYIDSIGDILMSHLPEMYIYRTYCANQKSAGRTLDEMRAADPQVADILRVRFLLYQSKNQAYRLPQSTALSCE